MTFCSSSLRLMCFRRAREASISLKSHQDASKVAVTGWLGPPGTSCSHRGKSATLSSGTPTLALHAQSRVDSCGPPPGRLVEAGYPRLVRAKCDIA